MSKKPWMKFWPRDWRGDQALRACSLGARGLWIEMISIMHEAAPYGHLVLDGQPVGNDVLARVSGAALEEVEQFLAELEKWGVFSRTRKGVIYSRRMTKDFDRSNKGRKAVQKRYAQTAENSALSPLPNRSGNSPPNTQKPEARVQKKKEYSPEFEEFWRDYPHPENPGGKGVAASKFKHLSKADEEAARIGVENLRSYCDANKDWYHAPMAQTWLNQRRWETQSAGQSKSSPSPHAEMLAKYGRSAREPMENI